MRRARRSTKGGYSLSAEREYPPLHPPRERDEGSSPSTPHIAGLQLEELRSLRNQVRCTWLRHESLLLVTTRNRALLPWGACDVSTAADCLPNEALLTLAALWRLAVDGN